ncbi:hypothetical protein [Burkholderia plantarii]|uniref:Putative membrane protein n=1 Tax=Burkholderia plantarii TaxID=41899 RepID=A0A0B6S473_BURPL|nr:hypothetical protein [Burkholderia plantarii]AJK48120.1 putative membrane protein [Burkholderia plantarii]ALK32306.1 hypothetical protein bpln_2g00200 [Burkholderia plantarii]GLZ18841.1 hypothetical protein Bpla01_23710 [Burkholderia plantarii]
MPILIVLFVLAALAWGAIVAFRDAAAQFGTGIAIALAAVVAVLLAAALAAWIRRRREIAPNTKEGGWTHVMRHGPAALKLSSTQGLLWLSREGTEAHVTLSDVGACEARLVDGQWCLVVGFRDASRAAWTLPMPDRRAARRWARVVTLGQAGKL